MASLENRLRDLATRTGSECKSIRSLLNGNAADNTALLTTAKASLVAAINEVVQTLQAVQAQAGAQIDDTSAASASKTYSINKIRSELTATAQAVKNEILGGAGAAFDTLKELQDLLQGDATRITDIMTALGVRLRVDTADQGLTAAQKANARTNIDVFSKTEIGNPDTDFTAVFVTALT